MSRSYQVLLDVLLRVQGAAQPIAPSDGDLDARVPAALWRELVDAHADALYASSQPESKPDIDETCMTIQRAVADYTRRTPAHLRDCDVMTGHIVRYLRNAAPQELPAVSSASRWPTGEDSVPALQDGRSTAGAIRDSAKQPAGAAPGIDATSNTEGEPK